MRSFSITDYVNTNTLQIVTGRFFYRLLDTLTPDNVALCKPDMYGIYTLVIAHYDR